MDLIVGHTAIEVKATELITSKHLKGLRALKEEGLLKTFIVVSLDTQERVTKDGIQILPWELFLKNLWHKKII